MNKRGYSKISILITLVLVAIVGSLYLQAQDANKEADAQKQLEEEFNNSGRAKAIESEQDLWKVYVNEVVGISLKYPGGVEVNVDVQDVSTMEQHAPLGYGKETSLANMAALSEGEYGQSVSFPLIESKKVRKLSESTNAQEFMVLARFEVCDVTFARRLYFFNNDHLITVSVNGDKESIVQDSVQYFTYNRENCGEQLIWDFDKQGDFYNSLVRGEGGVVTQEWFDTFDEIINTIDLTSIE